MTEKKTTVTLSISLFEKERERAWTREREAVKRKSKKLAEGRNESSNERDDIWWWQRVH